MSYTIIHEYRCDGCNRVVRLPQCVMGYYKVGPQEIPGFKWVGDRTYCGDCYEQIVSRIEDIQDELRTKHGL